MSFSRLRYFGQKTLTLLKHEFNDISTWFFSILATIGVPMIPIIVQWFRDGKVTDSTFFIVEIVLAATYLFSSEHNFFRCIYIVFLAFAVILDFTTPGGWAVGALDTHHGAWALLAGIAGPHATERFWWHAVESRPFPDVRRR